MPAYSDSRDFTASDDWVLVTASDVTAITFKNVGGLTWWIAATVGATPPAQDSYGVPVAPDEGEANFILADVFLGVTGANRVYVRAPKGGRGFFSHA